MRIGKLQLTLTGNLDAFEEMLEGYHDMKIIDYLKYGFPLNATDIAINEERPSNQKGAQAHPAEISEYIKNELKAGTMIGPFHTNPFGKEARFSPLDTRPKKESDQLRVILNLSYPFRGESVNSGIGKSVYAGVDNMELKYPTVDDLVKIVRRKGKKCQNFRTRSF